MQRKFRKRSAILVGMVVAIVAPTGLLAQGQEPGRPEKVPDGRRSPAGRDLIQAFQPHGQRIQVQPAELALWFLYLKDRVGLSVKTASDVLRRPLNIPKGQGLVVKDVTSDSLAHQAGIQVHDILLSVGGKTLRDGEDLEEALKAGEGESVEVDLLRTGEKRTITLQRPKDEKPLAFSGSVGVDRGSMPDYHLGVSLATMTETLRAQLDLPHDGAVITEVFANTPAETAGLKQYDVLLKVDGEPIHGPENVQKAVQKSEGKPIEFQVLRNRKPITATVTPETRTIPSRVRLNVDKAGRLSRTLRLAPGVIFRDREQSLAAKGPTAQLQRQLNQLSQQLEEVRQSIEELKQTLPKADAADPTDDP